MPGYPKDYYGLDGGTKTSERSHMQLLCLENKIRFNLYLNVC